MPKVIILDKYGKTNRLYTAWAGSLSCEYQFEDDYDLDWVPPSDCALIVTAQHYQVPESLILLRCVDLGIPVLILADGILEYRNTWLRPDTPDACIFQPVIGHKIAVIGRSQGRILESWGNTGKCEIVGLPRLDCLLSKKARKRLPSGPFRILVMTARIPAFNDEQQEYLVAGLMDIKTWFESNGSVGGVTVEPVWRISQGLEDIIGVHSETSTDLTDVLGTVDAVISTPSTAMLEAMLVGLPVVRLDYGNFPQYIDTAWSITAPCHIAATINELLHPPTAKLLFQDTMLHDALECRSASMPRMLQLIEAMVKFSIEAGTQQKPLSLPAHILPHADCHREREERFDLQSLYPMNPVFSCTDPVALQVEVEHLKKKVAEQNKVLDHYGRTIERRSLLGRVRAMIDTAREKINVLLFRSGENSK